jgi:hypothetical protein
MSIAPYAIAKEMYETISARILCLLPERTTRQSQIWYVVVPRILIGYLCSLALLPLKLIFEPAPHVLLSLFCFRPYLMIVLSICSISSGPSFFRTNFPIEITLRMSPRWSHTAFPIIGPIFNLGKTLTDTSKNCSSPYRGRCKRLNRDCNGLKAL